MIHHFYIVVFCLICSGCSLLETRTPENPENAVQYDPPFDYQTVLMNLKKSIQFKDPTGYVRCFSDSLNGSNQFFVFEPSIEVLTRYGGLFSQWNINQERVYFQNVMSKIPKEIQTELQLTNTSIDGITPDSVIIQSDYRLLIPHGMISISGEANGSLRFVIKRQTDGLWSIQRWTDFLGKHDTTGITWSVIKAQFNN